MHGFLGLIGMGAVAALLTALIATGLTRWHFLIVGSLVTAFVFVLVTVALIVLRVGGDAIQLGMGTAIISAFPAFLGAGLGAAARRKRD